jgi:hypothetical protein
MSSGKPLSKMHQRVNTLSEKRIALDEGEKQPMALNTFWDDAESVYTKSVLAIDQTHGQLVGFLKELVNDPQRLNSVADGPTLVNNINLLTRDIGEHKALLEAIHDEHKGFSGSTTTPDDHMAVLAIHGKYSDALEIYDSTIMPTVAHIFEQIGAVDELLKNAALTKSEEQSKALAEREKKTLAELRACTHVEYDDTDPSVITDAVIKEVKES